MLALRWSEVESQRRYAAGYRAIRATADTKRLIDHQNVRREFRRITQTVGIGIGWVPREMRHTFLSLHNSNGTAP